MVLKVFGSKWTPKEASGEQGSKIEVINIPCGNIDKFLCNLSHEASRRMRVPLCCFCLKNIGSISRQQNSVEGWGSY